MMRGLQAFSVRYRDINTVMLSRYIEVLVRISPSYNMVGELLAYVQDVYLKANGSLTEEIALSDRLL